MQQVCCCTQCVGSLGARGGPGLLVTKGLASLHRKRDVDRAREEGHQKVAMTTRSATSRTAPRNSTPLVNNNAALSNWQDGRSKRIKQEHVTSSSYVVEVRDWPAAGPPLVSPSDRIPSTLSNPVDASTTNPRPSSGVKRPSTSALYPDSLKELRGSHFFNLHGPAMSAATKPAIIVKTEVSDSDPWKKHSLPTPSFYNEPSLSSVEFDNLLVTLGREALTQDMEAVSKKMKDVMELQRRRLGEEKKAAMLLIAERDKSERRSAIRVLRRLQAECKDLEELLSVSEDEEVIIVEEDFAYQEVMSTALSIAMIVGINLEQTVEDIPEEILENFLEMMYLRVPALQNLESDWTIMQILKRTVNQGGIPQDSEEEDEDMNTLPLYERTVRRRKKQERNEDEDEDEGEKSVRYL